MGWADSVFKMPRAYEGDGLPLCESIGSFLSSGASFEFSRFADAVASSGLVLSSDSALYPLLCLGEGAQCEFPLHVTLSDDLACTAEECDAGTVTEVMVSGAVYRYHAPPCVHLLFSPALPRLVRNFTPEYLVGYCADADGTRDKRLERVKLDSLNVGDTPERREQCLEKCRSRRCNPSPHFLHHHYP